MYLLWNDETGIADLIDNTLGNSDNSLSRSEANMLFGDGENCTQPVMMYCKFTSQITVAWS